MCSPSGKTVVCCGKAAWGLRLACGGTSRPETCSEARRRRKLGYEQKWLRASPTATAWEWVWASASRKIWFILELCSLLLVVAVLRCSCPRGAILSCVNDQPLSGLVSGDVVIMLLRCGALFFRGCARTGTLLLSSASRVQLRPLRCSLLSPTNYHGRAPWRVARDVREVARKVFRTAVLFLDLWLPTS